MSNTPASGAPPSGTFSSTASGSLFGTGSTNTSGSTATSFSFGSGATSGPSPGGGPLFGTPATSTPAFGASNPNPSSTPFSSQKSAPPTSASTPSALFGGSKQSLFNQTSQTPSSSLFGATSTTPAGAPPGSLGPAFGSVAGGNSASSGGLFGSTGQTSGAGGGLFGQQASTASKPVFGNPNTSASTSGGIFGPSPGTLPATGVFGGGAQAQTAGGGGGGSLFGQKPGTEAPVSAFGGGGGTPTTPAAKPPAQGLFGSNSGASSTPAAASSASPLFGGLSKPPATGLFGAPTSSTTKEPTTAATSAATAGIFGASSATASAAGPASAALPSTAAGTSFFGTPPTSAGASTPTVAPSPGVFPKKNPAASEPGATTSATSIPSNTAPVQGGLFGGQTTTSSAPATNAQGATAGSGPGPSSQPEAPAASASSASMAPPPQSRLKNKSMEEIINRWTSDLEKYKAEFALQAADIKKWDNTLIENGDKITTLYSETLEAEKTQGRMDNVLQQLESDQEELGTALDYYEAQIKDLFEAQMGGVEGMQPADQEREKAYHLAEKLNDQLAGMGNELGGMIKEINKASTTINKTTNVDDPLSQIVKILNDHLSSLQWIDSHTTSIAGKITEAYKKSRDGAGGALSGDGDYFPSSSYRSMR